MGAQVTKNGRRARDASTTTTTTTTTTSLSATSPKILLEGKADSISSNTFSSLASSPTAQDSSSSKKESKILLDLVTSSPTTKKAGDDDKKKAHHHHHHRKQHQHRHQRSSDRSKRLQKSSGSGRASRSSKLRNSSGALPPGANDVAAPLATDDTAASLIAATALLEVIEEDLNDEQEQGSDVENDNFIGDALALEGGDEERTGSTVQYLSSEREILVEQERAVREIAEVLSLPAFTATQLLRHFRWNKDRLLHQWVDDAARVCREAGVQQQQQQQQQQRSFPTATASSPSSAMCLVCADTVSGDASFALSCGHVFCHGCWAHYLSLKIAEGNTALTCAALKCPVALDQSTVQRLVPPADYERYLRFMSKTFVDTNPNVRWCPAPGCGHAINVLDAERDCVVCRCGFRFCFACKHESHVPATCEQVQLWAKKGQDDSETTHWLLANTMECPKCKCTIEKNGGCNHMTCRQCRYEFCWLCRQNWKGHNDYYSCNRFQKAQASNEGASSRGSKKKETAREREAREKEESRVALEKYLHYYKRYTDHDRSRRFETQVREEARRKMREMQETDATWVGVQFIAKAAEQLIACRSVLKWSYVYAYYLADGSPAKNLFEYLQKDLEQTTEELSAALSAPVEALQRVPVMNLTKVAERMAAALSAAAEQAVSPPTPTPAPARAGSSRK